MYLIFAQNDYYPSPEKVMIYVPLLTVIGGLIILTVSYLLDEVKKK